MLYSSPPTWCSGAICDTGYNLSGEMVGESELRNSHDNRANRVLLEHIQNNLNSKADFCTKHTRGRSPNTSSMAPRHASGYHAWTKVMSEFSVNYLSPRQSCRRGSAVCGMFGHIISDRVVVPEGLKLAMDRDVSRFTTY